MVQNNQHEMTRLKSRVAVYEEKSQKYEDDLLHCQNLIAEREDKLDSYHQEVK